MPAQVTNPSFRAPPSPEQQQQQQQQRRPPPLQTALAHTAPQQPSTETHSSPPVTKVPGSPVAPEYSPITPKIQPVLPATIDPPPFVEEGPAVPEDGASISTSAFAQQPQPQPQQQAQSQSQSQQHQQAPNTQQHQQQHAVITPAIPRAEFIPEPAPQPFSSADSTDALALRAAISSLQFQKKKAQDDLLVLDRLRERAVGDPEAFRRELASGRVLERKKPGLGDWRDVLDEEDDDDDDDEYEEDVEREHAKERRDSRRADSRVDLNSDTVQQLGKNSTADGDVEMSGQTGRSDHETIKSEDKPEHSATSTSAPFDHIPGPQNIVRMPYINWHKYHIAGDGLDQLHAQQQRWPGSYEGGNNNTPLPEGRGREHVAAAPYSPFLDRLGAGEGGGLNGDAKEGRRGDGVGGGGEGGPGASGGMVATPSTTVSEHPMATRRAGRMMH